jgi:Asp/Glu/hydantoin racemase
MNSTTLTASTSPPRIAFIHALPHSVAPINSAMNRLWPLVTRMNLQDDSLSQDLAQAEAAMPGTGLDAFMHERFARLTQYAVDCGADAILFTCSAFGSCIEAAAKEQSIPVLKPNEAMIEQAQALVGTGGAMQGQLLGLLSSFAPTLVSMPPEFPKDIRFITQLAQGAMAALNTGDVALHDELIVASAKTLVVQGAKVIALAQYSMAHCKPLVEAACGVPVLTTTDSAIEKLKRLLA